MSNPDDDLKIFLPEGREVVIAGEKFTIMPFVLRNRTKVLRILADIFKELSTHDLTSASQAGMVNLFIDLAGDRLVEIYEMVIPKNREWLESHVQLKDEVAIIKAVIELNDFPFLMSQISVMMTANHPLAKK